jgi:hypothetical protein
MSYAREMLDAAPGAAIFEPADLASAIDACGDCVQTCIACADADVAERDVAEMRACIGLCLDCADVCAATLRVLSRQARYDDLMVQRLLQACARACSSCAEECSRHAAHHRHCAVCAESCAVCEQACRKLLDAEALEELQALAGG